LLAGKKQLRPSRLKKRETRLIKLPNPVVIVW
jgi:hypothetical protein